LGLVFRFCIDDTDGSFRGLRLLASLISYQALACFPPLLALSCLCVMSVASEQQYQDAAVLAASRCAKVEGGDSTSFIFHSDTCLQALQSVHSDVTRDRFQDILQQGIHCVEGGTHTVEELGKFFQLLMPSTPNEGKCDIETGDSAAATAVVSFAVKQELDEDGVPKSEVRPIENTIFGIPVALMHEAAAVGSANVQAFVENAFRSIYNQQFLENLLAAPFRRFVPIGITGIWKTS